MIDYGALSDAQTKARLSFALFEIRAYTQQEENMFCSNS